MKRRKLNRSQSEFPSLAHSMTATLDLKHIVNQSRHVLIQSVLVHKIISYVQDHPGCMIGDLTRFTGINDDTIADHILYLTRPDGILVWDIDGIQLRE